MKWLFRVWLSVNIIVLVQAILSRETPSSGGGLAMVMFLLNMPSSLLTGISLNTLGVVKHASHSLNMLLIWIPFFTLGAIQWVLLKWFVRKIWG
jgi:hypothetical protein